MTAPARNGTTLLVSAMLAATAIAIAEFAGFVDGRGALLVTLALWAAVAQGSVAVVAAGELTGARWIQALKPELLSAARLLPFLVVLFLFALPRLGLYAWSSTPGRWLAPTFFAWRNVAMLAVTAGAGLLFARASLRGWPGVKRIAVLYLLAYVVNQTLVAFDWIMSLSWPWVSSMFGLYFFVEALYAGLATAGILFLLLHRRRGSAEGWRAARQDAGLLLFGFSVLWGGLFFAQFMLLWYGNLPEEVSFIATRLASTPSRQLIPAFLVLCFGVPFVGLLSAVAKRSVVWVALVSVAILLGITAERLVFVLPVLPLHFGVLAVENAIMVALWAAAVFDAKVEA